MAELLNVPTQNSIQYTLDSQLSAGATSSLTLNQSVSGVVQAPGVCVIDRIDSSGNVTASKREYIKFSGVSGSQLTGLTRAQGGSSDQVHSVGAIVEFIPDVVWAQSVYDTITTEHSVGGVHASLPSLVQIRTGSIQALSTASINLLNIGARFSASGASIVGFYPSGASGTFLQSLGDGVRPVFGTPIANLASGSSIFVSSVQTNLAYFPSVASTTLQEFGVQNLSGHLILRPGSSRLTGGSIHRQDDTSNSFMTKAVVQVGWGWILGASDNISESVTFPTPFISAPIVTVSTLGGRNGSNPTVITDLTADPGFTISVANSISTTGFTVIMRNATFNTSIRYGYSWVAIGEI